MKVVPLERWQSLNNDGDRVLLTDHTGAPADSMDYDDAPAGVSLECIDPSMGGTRGWDLSVAPGGATPGRVNSIALPSDPEARTRKVTVTIDPNPFRESATITCAFPFPLTRVRLVVYDRRGREIIRLADGVESGSTWSCVWDGRADGRRVAAGPYILLLEALDKRVGRVESVKATVVVAPQR